MNPLDLIKAIRESFIGAEQVYTQGSCFWFFKILKVVFPEAEPYWSETNKHLISKIGKKFYDITGEVFPDKTYSLDEGEYNRLSIAVALPENDKNAYKSSATMKKL